MTAKRAAPMPRLVEIAWDDAVSFVGETHDASQKVLEPLCHPVRIRTVGWLMCENDDGYLLAADYQEFPSGTDRVRDVQFIPKSAVSAKRNLT